MHRQCINTITLRDKKQELAYFIYFFVLSWLLPILVMLFCYVSIIVTICRRQSHNHSLTNNSENARGKYFYIQLIHIMIINNFNSDRVFKEQSSDIDWKSQDENYKDHWILNSWFYSLLVSLSDELPLVCKLKLTRAHYSNLHNCLLH